MTNVSRRRIILILTALLLASGCKKQLPQIIIYSDPEPFLTFRLMYYFTRENKVAAKQQNYGADFDTVAHNNSYSGARNAALLTAERDHPKADVYWSGDPIYCEILRQRGVLVPYHSTSSIPPEYRDPDDYWTGFAARTRVLLVRASLKRSNRPTSIQAFVDPAWKGRGAIADPLEGTTRSQFAALSLIWGDKELARFWAALQKNGTQVTKTNDEAADLVVNGDADFALVDSDIAMVRVRDDLPLDIVYPDQSPTDIGCMVMPNAVSIVKGTKNLASARKFVNFVTSLEGERRIVGFASWQVPLNVGVGTGSPLMWQVNSLRTIHVDYPAAAKKHLMMEQILGSETPSNGSKE
jgi:iron(III) transport system substrate-binding protein